DSGVTRFSRLQNRLARIEMQIALGLRPVSVAAKAVFAKDGQHIGVKMFRVRRVGPRRRRDGAVNSRCKKRIDRIPNRSRVFRNGGRGMLLGPLLRDRMTLSPKLI